LLKRRGGLVKAIPAGHGDGDRALGEKPGEPAQPRAVGENLNRGHRDSPLGGRQVTGDGGEPAAVPDRPALDPGDGQVQFPPSDISYCP
jgi:hypothetical protein